MSLAVPIKRIQDLSNNVILSCEANNLDGYAVNDSIATWLDNSGLSNNLLPSYFNQMVLYNMSLTQEEGRIIRHLKFKWGV